MTKRRYIARNAILTAVSLVLSACSTNANDPAPYPVLSAPMEDALSSLSGDFDAGEWPGVTSMLITVDGTLLVEDYAQGVSIDDTHDLRSATKSVTAILIGELIEDGLISSVDQPVTDLIPRRFSPFDTSDLKRQITVKDLLTMRSGMACDDWVPASLGQEDKMYETPDWVAFFLSQPRAHERGEHFSYCTGGVVLLGELLTELSGMTVSEFANERLFGPLGILSAQWADTPTGGTDTGGHLEMTAADFHTLGVTLLDGNPDIISPDWFDAMVGYQTDVYERRSTYGYLWWRDRVDVDGRTLDYHYAHGNGGNFIFAVPDLGLVASFTGTNFGSRLQFQPVSILRDRIIPAVMDSMSTETD